MLNNATTSATSKNPIQSSSTAVKNSNRSEDDTTNEPAHSATGWVTKRDRHMQLINSSVFDKETQIRNKAIDQTRRQKAFHRDQREKVKIHRHLQAIAAHTSRSSALPAAIAPPVIHEISVEGLRFHVMNGGSKLTRIRGEMKLFVR